MKCFRIVVIFAALAMSGCAAKNPSLVDHGNGIVTVASSPLMWQQGRSRNFSTWEEAKRYADELELGGYSDWRLPTRDEFLDLYFAFDFGNAKGGKQTIRLEGNYWSAENDGIGYTGAWKDGASCEISRAYKKSTQGYVRAVRP